jgi:hypothetical protein
VPEIVNDNNNNNNDNTDLSIPVDGGGVRLATTATTFANNINGNYSSSHSSSVLNRNKRMAEAMGPDFVRRLQEQSTRETCTDCADDALNRASASGSSVRRAVSTTSTNRTAAPDRGDEEYSRSSSSLDPKDQALYQEYKRALLERRRQQKLVDDDGKVITSQ